MIIVNIIMILIITVITIMAAIIGYNDDHLELACDCSLGCSVYASTHCYRNDFIVLTIMVVVNMIAFFIEYIFS